MKYRSLNYDKRYNDLQKREYEAILLDFLVSAQQNDSYKEWVKIWKRFYKNISGTIKRIKHGEEDSYFKTKHLKFLHSLLEDSRNDFTIDDMLRVYPEQNYLDEQKFLARKELSRLCKILLDYRELNKTRNKEHMKNEH